MTRKTMVLVGSWVVLAAGLRANAVRAGHEVHGEAIVEKTRGKSAAAAEPLRGVWQSVKKREAELAGLITSKQLGKVHEVAFAIRDLIATLPEKSPDLGPEQKAKLAGNVKFVATLAQRLDAAGDANDQAATEASFKQLQAVLGAIQGLYPAGALE